MVSHQRCCLSHNLVHGSMAMSSTALVDLYHARQVCPACSYTPEYIFSDRGPLLLGCGHGTAFLQMSATL